MAAGWKPAPHPETAAKRRRTRVPGFVSCYSYSGRTRWRPAAQRRLGTTTIMVENAPFLSCQYGGLTAQGYSRAAVESNWRVPGMKSGFELGAPPLDFMWTATLLLSHYHRHHLPPLPG